MSALYIYDHAPLGALIRFSDGAPRPPERHRRKLNAWKDRNGVGQLIAKEPPEQRPTYNFPGSLTLHMGDYGSGGIVVLRVQVNFALDSALSFEIAERPQAGMVRVLNRWAGRDELIHLAADEAAARDWLTHHGYPNAVLDVVGDDDGAPRSGERRAA